MSDAMNAPVTRGELREELAELRDDLDRRLATKSELREELAELRDDIDRRLATKAELREEGAKLATKAELREEVAKLATKAELREEVAKLATKAELHSALEIWAGALREELKADAQRREDRIIADAQQREERMTERIERITTHVSNELARHVGAALERTRSEIGAIDDKYANVLPRLASVEAQAHTHTEPPPKATGRRSR